MASSWTILFLTIWDKSTNPDSHQVFHVFVEEGRVHGGDEHGEADEEEAEDSHELAQVDEQARDDDRPGAEHVVELQEVKDLDHAQEERPGQHLVPENVKL